MWWQYPTNDDKVFAHNEFISPLIFVLGSVKINIHGLVSNCSNSIDNALELLQSCTKPSICTSLFYEWIHESWALFMASVANNTKRRKSWEKNQICKVLYYRPLYLMNWSENLIDFAQVNQEILSTKWYFSNFKICGCTSQSNTFEILHLESCKKL